MPLMSYRRAISRMMIETNKMDMQRTRIAGGLPLSKAGLRQFNLSLGCSRPILAKAKKLEALGES